MNKQKLPFLTYDTKRMDEDIPIRSVMQMYAGINASETARKNVRCPSPNHADKKPSAHIYGNKCKCFACGGNFSPVSLAKEYFPELSFAEVCQKLLDDCGMSVYEYSNKAEIEAIQRANGNHKFYDYFPITEDELNAIGLSNPKGNEEYKYLVRASEYYNRLYGEIPPRAEVYGKNGSEIMIPCSAGEAREIGIATRTNQEHEYIEGIPTIQQLWKEDKESTESMIVDKCHETIDALAASISETKEIINDYRDNHTEAQMNEADKLRSGYMKALSEGKFVRLSPAQKDKINDLYLYEKSKSILPALSDKLTRASDILDKVTEHQKERVQAQKTEKKKMQIDR